jgi:predicted CXXCH cytochrome family protein
MHMSECYKQTESLTCITCHNPHDTPGAQQQVAHYRSICLSCHEDQACGKPRDQRIELADNSCYQCHMPKADTDVVHAALHHHRIGIHDSQDKAAQQVVAGLSPVLDISAVDAKERARCEALAKAQVFRGEPGNPAFANYGVEAIGALVKLKGMGVNDAELNAVLSWLAHSQGESNISRMLASEVLTLEAAPTRNRIEALRLLAQDALKRRDKQRAVEWQREVARHNRDATDMYFLGVCENNAGNTEAGIDAFQRSLQIDPSQEAAHVALQAIYQAQGKLAEAQHHAEQAVKNQQLSQRLRAEAMELMKKEQAAP